MHENVKEAFRAAMKRSAPILQSLIGQNVEHSMVWRKTDQGWRSEWEARPSLINANAYYHLKEPGDEFMKVFLSKYPEYEGAVGYTEMQMRLSQDPSFILGQAMAWLLERHGTFENPCEAIDAIVQEFAEYVDLPDVRFRFRAQLLNYRMKTDTLPLPGNLVIRRLTELEMSEVYGGPVYRLFFMPRRAFLSLQEFAIEGECSIPKCIGDWGGNQAPAIERVRPLLDKAVLTLRTFKQGPVGYDQLRFRSVHFCPLQLPVAGIGDLHVPLGVYEITEEEAEPLQAHASMIFSFNEPVMTAACSRLADAQTRARPEDRLVDAVIGLESLLLAGLGKEDRRGELKYRFALNYSTLFGSAAERYGAFRIAKDLYDLRSTIAHGHVPKRDNSRVGDERLTLENAATRACEVLRGVIKRFLPHSQARPYMKHEFWERAYFQIPDES